MTRMQQRLIQESAAVIAVLGMCNGPAPADRIGNNRFLRKRPDSADRQRFPSSHRRVTAISMA